MSVNLYIKDFKSLKVWQKANALEQEIGELVKGFPNFEQYRTYRPVSKGCKEYR